MKSQESPVTWRANADDRERLDYLQKRTGLAVAGILRLALKRLFDAEKKLDK